MTLQAGNNTRPNIRRDVRCISFSFPRTMPKPTPHRNIIMLTPQQEFDERYITTTEIVATLGVSRSTVHIARTMGRLGEPIDVQGQMFIWERAKIKPYLDAWKLMLDTRRGVAVA